MTKLLVSIVCLMLLVARTPSQAAQAVVEGVVFKSHSGEMIDPASGSLSAGMTSGDFSFTVRLVAEGLDRAVVGVVWAFVRDGEAMVHRNGAQFFDGPTKAGAVFRDGVARVTLAVPYAYRDSDKVFPEAALGQSVLRAYIGGSGMVFNGPNATPTGYWCVADTPVNVVQENPAGYGFLVEDHRRLKLGSQVSVCVLRPTSTGSEVMELYVKEGNAILGSSLAFFPDGDDVTTVNMRPLSAGALVLFGQTAAGDAVWSMPLWAGGQDEFPAPDLPADGGNATECDFAGGPESGTNPKFLCGGCALIGDPVAPPECAPSNAQQFVQNGRCSAAGWLGQICCKWTKVNVPNAKFYMQTEAVAPVDCFIGINFTVPRTRGLVSIQWQPKKLCCSWGVNGALPPAPTSYNRCITRPWMPGNPGHCKPL